MPPATQALPTRTARRRGIVLACLALLPLAGCASGGGLKAAETDSSLYTNSVSAQDKASQDKARLSDQSTIRNAVSAADLEAVASGSLPWANAETGARGAISNLAETRHGEITCRTFSTTRESFDGVRLYRGEACMGAAGGWSLQAFDPV